MDHGLHLLLLSAAALACGICPPDALAQAPVGEGSETPQVVVPQIDRRDVKPPRIDAENFEAGAFVGTIAIEDFGSSMTYGARAAYHFTEDLFAEATIGTAKAGRTSYEDLSGSLELLTDIERSRSAGTCYRARCSWAHDVPCRAPSICPSAPAARASPGTTTSR